MLMKTVGTIVIIILAIAVSLAADDVQARQMLNIGLTRFEAIPLDNAVRLEWDTETELGTAGYRLKRGQNGSFSYLLDPASNENLFVVSEGGPALGSNYSFIDDTAVNGAIYTYQLIEVTIDGSETIQADHTVTAGVIPTNTPIVLGGGGGGGGDTVQDTPTPEPTNTATATQDAAGTPLPSPTTAPIIASTATPLATATQFLTAEVLETAEPTRAIEIIPTALSLETDTTTESEQPDNSGIAIAQAMEESAAEKLPGYPGAGSEETVQEPQTPTDTSTTGQEGNSDPVDSSNGSNSQPSVIGNNKSIDNRPVPEYVVESQESNTSEGALAGRIYLWIAFIAALVIFVAAVLGAILLYTRHRNRV